jgi:hypothetical protein
MRDRDTGTDADAEAGASADRAPGRPERFPVPPTEAAAILAAFVDALIPGDDLFPPASTVGVQAMLADRLRDRVGPEGAPTLVRWLQTGVADFATAPTATRLEAVARLEREAPDLFAMARMATYLGYYATPTVTTAIRVLGHDYNDAPQPRGYPLAPFDPTPGADVPAVPRGAYKRTEEMAPLDPAALAALAAELGLPMRQIE